jgi:hypothetical protein
MASRIPYRIRLSRHLRDAVTAYRKHRHSLAGPWLWLLSSVAASRRLASLSSFADLAGCRYGEPGHTTNVAPCLAALAFSALSFVIDTQMGSSLVPFPTYSRVLASPMFSKASRPAPSHSLEWPPILLDTCPPSVAENVRNRTLDTPRRNDRWVRSCRTSAFAT